MINKLISQLLVLLLLIGYNNVMADSDGMSGKELSFDRSKGNCLACHMIEDGELPGLLGPPLISMKARYPDREKLRAQIWDATERNPATSMPPFGKHGILTEEELDKVVDYIHSL